jgi:hypothetical protein
MPLSLSDVNDSTVDIDRVVNLKEIIPSYKCDVCLNLMIDPVQVV